MGRPSQWPPRPYPHKQTGMERVTIRLKGVRRDFILGPIGSGEARRAYVRIISEVEAAGSHLPPRRQDRLRVGELTERYLWNGPADTTRPPQGSFRPSAGPSASSRITPTSRPRSSAR